MALEKKVDKFVEDLVVYRGELKDSIEPSDGKPLEMSDQKALTTNNSFKKLIIITNVLNILSSEGSEGYLPLFTTLIESVDGDMENFLQLYKVTFTKDLHDNYMPKVTFVGTDTP
tara:strand:- start:1601 stop:1945 length:345 start_codon:yes stop_codon:yes gene_type:complete